MNMRRNRDMQGLQALQDTLIAQTYEQIKKEGKRTLTRRNVKLIRLLAERLI